MHYVEAYPATAVDNDVITWLNLGAILDRVIGRGHCISNDAAFHKWNFFWEDENIFGRSFHVLGIGSIYIIAEHAHALADILTANTTSYALSTGEDGWQ